MGALPFSWRSGLQMNGLQTGVCHKDRSHRFPPDGIGGSGFEELLFCGRELFVGIFSRGFLGHY